MFRQRIWLWTLLALVALGAGSYLLFILLRPEPLPPGILYGNGYIEVTEVEVSAEVTGRIEESGLVEGQRVEKGDLLVRIRSADIRANLGEARAQVEATRAAMEALRQQLATARHHLGTAESEVARYRELRGQGIVTPEQLDQVQNRFEEARGQVRSLEAQIRESEARLEAARRRVEVLELQLQKTEIHAPISGSVLTRATEAGELAAPGRLVAVLGDLARPELRVFIPEGDIAKVKLGEPARVRVDAFPRRYFPARVVRIDQQAQFTPRDIHVPEERVRMVFGVTLALENPEGLLKPGMPADAWIRWQQDAAWPERLTVPE